MRDRQLFELLVKMFPGITPQPSYLRQDIKLENNKTTYLFEFDGENNAQAKLPQKGLKKQDIFVSNVWGLFLLREADIAVGTGVLQTYVNTTYFPVVAGFTPEHLNLIYAGNIEAVVNDTTVFNALQSEAFQSIPELLQSGSAIRSKRMPIDGYQAIEPNFKLNGELTRKITLEIPSIAGMQIASVTAGTENKVSLIQKGFLLRGASAQDLEKRGYF